MKNVISLVNIVKKIKDIWDKDLNYVMFSLNKKLQIQNN